ncbi:hypothetical protein OE88DRAFT_1721575 [Heliocybe sulcata]|uniref:Uncharacterized protein n=1 Tax=Heliocybe sulcata TaxID=5364 RepID=A0A5C3NHI3_9AGAM|nr:hypothetical protein OE88DRAFT_1721575 [Heliocybe sulcata]
MPGPDWTGISHSHIVGRGSSESWGPLNSSPVGPEHELGPPQVPAILARAESRLQFPPSLFTDKTLYVPAWKKCQHGVVRGLAVGGIWAFMTFAIQRKFVELFLIKSPRVTGLSRDTILGFQVPFNLTTYATLLFLSTQVTAILTFFLSRNIRIARQRAWEQTVASRGKGPDFWQPYVEEWEHPPKVNEGGWAIWEKTFASVLGRFFVRRVLLLPFDIVPIAGTLISAGLRALGTARYLHQPYFESKKMSKYEIAVFIEERKWEYRAFGFAAALLEGLPIVGLLFTVSNRIGAAMWAHDLEKRQHYIASQKEEKTQ